MTHKRGHCGEPWNEMADSLAEAAMNGCRVPDSRKELERWMLGFRRVPGAAAWACAALPPWCEEWTSIFEECKEPPLVNVEPKEMKSFRVATPCTGKGSQWFEDSVNTSATREHL